MLFCIFKICYYLLIRLGLNLEFSTYFPLTQISCAASLLVLIYKEDITKNINSLLESSMKNERERSGIFALFDYH
jgi:hypothetical protein